MSNTVTLTFNETLPIVGKVINLNQIDALGITEILTFTYGGTPNQAFSILPARISRSLSAVRVRQMRTESRDTTVL